MTSSSIICAGCKQGYVPSALFCPNCGRPKQRETVTDALVGKVLGERFVVHELLGQGGSGTIYRAEHVTLRRKVAIKVLHDELSRDDLAVERFRREATTVAEIDNEHIVEIHDFGRTPDGRLYLAMELLEGETLDNVLARERTLSVERTADIVIQVGEALMEAHAVGYVHRDLRPRNLYLAVRRGKANFVKLLDFGLAKLVETDAQAASTSLGMTFGDPRYMSPEQARGDRIDRRADIYQLGCVAYEMLTGSPPFTGNRVFDILTKQVSEIPAPLPTRRPGVPLWMEAAVAKMLAKDPINRFATTTRMVEALRRGLETGEVMEDEVARRRESIPPPSVSRVMQKMGLDKPTDEPAVRPTPPLEPSLRSTHLGGHNPAPAATPEPAPNLRSTQMGGHNPAPAATAEPAANLRSTQMGGHNPAPAATPAPADPRATMLGRGDTAVPAPNPAVPVAVAPAPSAPVGGVPAPIPAVVSPSSGVPSPIPAPSPSPIPAASPSPSPSTSSPSLPPIGGVPAPVRVPPAMRVTPSATQPPVPTAPPPPAPAPEPAADLRSTHLGTGQHTRPRTASAPPPAAEAEPRRRTGTPRVGVPVAAQPAPEEEPNLPPVTGVIHAAPERSDRARKPTNDPAAISQVWYEDEELGPDKARKLVSISTTDLYEDEAPRKKNRLFMFIGLGAVLLVGGAIALAVGGGGNSTPSSQPPPSPAPIAAITAPIDAAPSTVIASETPDAAEVAPAAPDAATIAVVQPPKKDDPVRTDPPRHDPPTHVAPPTHITPPTNDEDPANRRPHFGTNNPTPPPKTDPPKKNGVSGADGPVDPYGGGEADPTDSPQKKAEFYAGVGQQQLGSGDTAGAAASFKKAAELDPNNATAAIGLGEIALRQGLFGDAIMHLNKAAKLAPKSSKVFTLLGFAYLNAGQNKQAAENFKKALQIDPDNAQARDGFNEASSHIPPPTDD